jgi:hypothetical protein
VPAPSTTRATRRRFPCCPRVTHQERIPAERH